MCDYHDAAGDDRARGMFAEGQGDPARYAEDTRVGRFSDGQAQPTAQLQNGRFSDGMEALGDDDPEKDVVGSFGDEELAA
jgi:hypothetical protein